MATAEVDGTNVAFATLFIDTVVINLGPSLSIDEGTV
jgi:hypothetical protein